MTSKLGNDPFFDSDGDQEKEEPITLKGEYQRGITPPSQFSDLPQNDKPHSGNTNAGHKSLYSRSSTSGNYTAESDTMSHKRDSSGSYYGRSRSRSRSPAYSRSRSRSPAYTRSRSRTPTYSDSFDSEDSMQDSRRASPIRNRKSTRRSPASTNRYSSGTSKDSRSTYRTYGISSGYTARTTKHNVKKGAPKKKGVGRSQSVTNLQQSPRSNEVTRRMLSAKGHTINKLRSDFDDLRRKYDDAIRENKLMKQLQRRQEAALAKFEDKDEELPQLLRSHAAEVDNLRERLRRTQEREKDKDRRIKDKNEEMNKLNDELKKLRHLADNKRLLERDKLQKKLDRLQDNYDEKERRVNELEKHVENMKKNARHDAEQWKQREREYRARVAYLEEENQNMKYQLKEKEKELEIKNIYSNRGMKAPAKLNPTLDLTPRPLAQTRATSNDDIKSTKPPPTLKRSSSAEEKRKMDLTPRGPKEEFKLEDKKETPRKEEKKEEKKKLSEHEKILMDLDAGFKPIPPPSKQDDDILQDLDNEIKKRERLDEEKIRADERRKREKEEQERRRKAEEEEKRRLQKKEEEERRRKEEEERKERERNKKEDDRRREEEELAAQRKKQKEESERLAEERRKKDILLAKMREIDSKPESRGSKKEYKFTQPIENLHNGKPSHPDLLGSPNSSPKKKPAPESETAFGGYAPSFGRRAAAAGDKPPVKKGGLFDDDDDSDDFFSTPKPKPADKSKDLMSNLFADSSKSTTPNKGRSSFEGSVFSTSTKAKPVADSTTLPWEKKTQPGSLFNQSNKPNGLTVNVPKSSYDDFDDDIEEVIL